MKNKKVLGIVALAAVTAVGGSFAYFQQTMVADNPFNTGSYSTTMQENFNPADGENWEPGATVNKDVFVTNTGTEPVVVRAKFDEVWTRTVKGENGAADVTTKLNEIKANDLSKEHPNDASKRSITNPYQEVPVDGATENDDTVVEKILKTPSKWVLGADGWYYYINTVDPEGTTDLFLDAVKLLENVDMGVPAKTFTYKATKEDGTLISEGSVDTTLYVKDDKVDLKKLSDALGLKKGDILTTDVVVNTNKAAAGYSNANYTLTITSQTVQATTEAIQNEFKNGDVAWVAPDGVKWFDNVKGSYVYAKDTKEDTNPETPTE